MAIVSGSDFQVFSHAIACLSNFDFACCSAKTVWHDFPLFKVAWKSLLRLFHACVNPHTPSDSHWVAAQVYFLIYGPKIKCMILRKPRYYNYLRFPWLALLHLESIELLSFSYIGSYSRLVSGNPWENLLGLTFPRVSIWRQEFSFLKQNFCDGLFMAYGVANAIRLGFSFINLKQSSQWKQDCILYLFPMNSQTLTYSIVFTFLTSYSEKCNNFFVKANFRL
jgi:hypothetical protein